MWPNDQIMLLFSRKKYSWVSILILSFYYTITFAIVLVGIASLLLCFGIKLRTLWDLILLEPYLTPDNNILFSISVVILTSAILGLISAFVYSQTGLLTSLAITLIIFSITNIYIIGFRVKNYISELDLYLLLNKKMKENLFDNLPLHLMQKSLSCCGIRHYEEWIDSINVIPSSCCKNSTVYCDKHDPSLFKQGCFDIITKILNETYQNSIEIIITLNIFLNINGNENKTFITIPRIQIPNNSFIQLCTNSQRTPRTSQSNDIVQEENNTVQTRRKTIESNTPVVYNTLRSTNANIEPIYPYLTMPEPTTQKY
ncbi:tetraspanin-6-like [Vespula squamosa]|uniref:Tetraspanin-6-like n=1 Tax=Vespula squamosa TaxID=30214 RepID=A0ABD2A4J9_VESSQ